jgi:hypothetical protein
MVISGVKAIAAFCWIYPLTPALPKRRTAPKGARGKGSRFVCFSNPEFNSVFHVGVVRINTSVSPLSLRERVRVRAADGQDM